MKYTIFCPGGMVYVYSKYLNGKWDKWYSYYRFPVHETTMALAA